MAPDSDQPIFDEDFVKGAAFTEPSARERDRAPGGLRRRRARKAAQDRQGRSGRGRQARRRRRAERRTEKLLYGSPSGPGWRATGRTKVASYVLIGAVLAAVVGGAIWEQSGLGRGAGGNGAIIIDGSGGGLGETPGAPEISPKDPFAGSPAAGYAEGEAGVQTPEPAAMNGLSAKDMELAYFFVRRTIVAGNLDPDVVFKGRHQPFTRLLQPDQRKDVTKALNLKGDGNLRLWMTMIVPGAAEPGSPIVKVNGSIKVKAAERDGSKGALVTADHLFVYAIQQPGRPGTLMRLIVRRTNEIFVYREGRAVRFWQYRSGINPAPVDCSAPDDGYVHPDFRRNGGSAADPGAPTDPYDLSKPLQTGGDCGTVTRV
ncbi:hypothetical protein [Spirillospora sp. NPDC047279]|uniref:SCO2583/SCO2584 N-terminal domain-containing protein n=1 Tax=Spirillospora sp. NPDC047279 TaxID=3155478 RepID=UPI0033CE6A87